MRQLVTILVLFAGFVLLFGGGVLVLTGLFPYTKPRSGIFWPGIAFGVFISAAGWRVRHAAMARWRTRTQKRMASP